MEPRDYEVIKIEGEYAYLREVGREDEDSIFIAMALLPQGIDVDIIIPEGGHNQVALEMVIERVRAHLAKN